MIDLDELQRLHEAATPGPWSANVDPSGWVAADHPRFKRGCRSVADCGGFNGRDEWHDAAVNAALIAAARNALPALLRLARRARRLEEAAAALMRIDAHCWMVVDREVSDALDALRDALAEGEE